MDTPPNNLRAFREERGVSQEAECEHLERLATRMGMRLRPTREMLSRMETGAKPVSAAYRQLFTRYFDASDEELGLAPSASHLAEEDTFSLARMTLASNMDPAVVSVVEDSTHRLCRQYSMTPPADLIPRVQERLKQIRALYRDVPRLDMHARLVRSAGWLYLLLAALHCDVMQRESALVSRDAALSLGREAEDPEIVGWAFETASWISLFDGLALDSLDAAEQGLKGTRPGGSAHIMNLLKVAQASAKLGDRLGAERAFEQAEDVRSTMGEPDFPDHHFVFDPPKLDYYGTEMYTWLGDASGVEHHTRIVVEKSGPPRPEDRRNHWNPTRVAQARLNWAQALVPTDLDHAAALSEQAMGTFLRRDTVIRAQEVLSSMTRHYPKAPEVERFREHFTEKRRTLP